VIWTVSPTIWTELMVSGVLPFLSSKPRPARHWVSAVWCGMGSAVSQASGGTGTWKRTVTTRPARATLIGCSGCQALPSTTRWK